jgi:pyridoxamine 5'-phosphate oxidase
MTQVDLAALRREYVQQSLDEGVVLADPIAQFSAWFRDAEAAKLAAEPNAMTLATADADGAPSARIVLLKAFDADGFVFYTDYRSRKGLELAANPRAALVFFWAELERQVRVLGTVAPVDRPTSATYFATRPVLSRVSAWTSHQSSVLDSRATLEARFADTVLRFPAGDVPLPEHWGGYRVSPTTIEFWQGRRSRLHDRLQYVRTADDGWRLERLSP